MNVILRKNSTSFRILLNIAGFYHLLGGIFIILSPRFFFSFGNLQPPNYIELWQMIGVYTAILGIGYFLASSNAIRHWRIVLLGFINKMVVVLWFVLSIFQGNTSSYIFKMVFINHFIWLFPFFIILYNAYKQEFVVDNELIRMNHVSADELLQIFTTNKMHTVTELAEQQPVMLVFLRHFGCTFCKETLLNIKKVQAEIEHLGTKIVFVNMLDEKKCMQELAKYNFKDVEYICDSESLLYKAFKLRRGSLRQLFGLKVIARALYLSFIKGIFSSSPMGADIYQMPGIFLIYKGAIVKQFIYESAADNPPYLDLARCDIRLAS